MYKVDSINTWQEASDWIFRMAPLQYFQEQEKNEADAWATAEVQVPLPASLSSTML